MPTLFTVHAYTMSRALNYTNSLLQYVDECNPPETRAQRRCREYTQSLPEHDMQIPPDEGRLLTFLARMTGARHIIEIGTFTGYSALCFAKGIRPDGRITCLDRSLEWTDIAREYWREDGVEQHMEVILGEAGETVAQKASQRPGEYDIAFIDADKESYLHYLEHCLTLVRAGGLIVADNTLWHGRVAAPEANIHDEDTHAIREFNASIREDNRVEICLIPFSDGVTLLLKK